MNSSNRLIREPPYYSAVGRFDTLDRFLKRTMESYPSFSQQDIWPLPMDYIESEKYDELTFQVSDMELVAHLISRDIKRLLDFEHSDLQIEVFLDSYDEFAFRRIYTDYTGEETDDLLNI